MEKPARFFQKKIIKKKSLKQDYKNKKHKKYTKATLKKEFLTNCQKAIEHIMIFNRIPMTNEKLTHLSSAILYLEKCLLYRPGNHLLRNQIKMCKEEFLFLRESNRRSADNVIELLLAIDLF